MAQNFHATPETCGGAQVSQNEQPFQFVLPKKLPVWYAGTDDTQRDCAGLGVSRAHAGGSHLFGGEGLTF